MWISESLFQDLDLPELARHATAAAREALPAVDIEFLHDSGMTICRVGPHFFPDPGPWRPDVAPWLHWARMPDKFLRDADDYWFHVYRPQVGDVIVDIGAGRGEDVFAFSHAVGAQGRVWGIEPHPISFDALGRLCAMNHLDNVNVRNYASMDRDVDLQIETLPVWESNYVRQGSRSATSYPVQGKPFDDIASEQGIDRIDFLKMNIEGAERFALPGCRAALQRAKFACVAAHDFRAARGEGEEFRTLDLVRRFLAEAGFTIVTRDRDPRYYVPYHVHGVRE